MQIITLREHFFRPLRFREMDGEAGEVVGGVGLEGEGAAVGGEDVADEEETEPLARGLGGEEGREKVFGRFGGDAATVVGDGQDGDASARAPCK